VLALSRARTAFAVLLPAVLILAVIVWVADRASGGDGAGPPAGGLLDPATPVLEETFPAAALPTLSEAQKGKIIALALVDEGLARLVRPGDLKVASVVPWVTLGDVELIGGVVELALPEPLELYGEFVLVDLDEDGQEYESITVRATFGNVTALRVNVDLRSERVVGLWVTRGATVLATPVFPPGYATPVP
jgi:hypothetical protein